MWRYSETSTFGAGSETFVGFHGSENITVVSVHAVARHVLRGNTGPMRLAALMVTVVQVGP